MMFAILNATSGAQQPSRSVLDGIYTEAQAGRGKTVYADRCAACHGAELKGSDTGGPTLVGPDFVNGWKDMSVGALFQKISTDMPSDAPGSLTPEQYADALAYVLSFNKYPVGQAELPTDAAALKAVKMAEPPRP
jgi:quinoprotein glucose dehydrogenase